MRKQIQRIQAVVPFSVHPGDAAAAAHCSADAEPPTVLGASARFLAIALLAIALLSALALYSNPALAASAESAQAGVRLQQIKGNLYRFSAALSSAGLTVPKPTTSIQVCC